MKTIPTLKRFETKWSFALLTTTVLLVSGMPSLSVQAQTKKESLKSEPLLSIPLETRLQTVVIPVKVNNQHTVNCILDTGMPDGLFLLDSKVAEKCKLEFVGSASVSGAGPGSQSANVALGANLQIEQIELANQRVIALQNPGSLAHLGVDGAIGASIFSKYVVEFDFENNRLSLFSPDSFDDRESGESIALDIINTKPFLQAKVCVDGKSVSPVTLLLDTGANKALSLNPTSTLTPPKKTISTFLGSGVGGDVNGAIGRIQYLQLGKLRLNQITTGFPDTQGIDQGGTLGVEALSRFLVTIDYPNKRMMLRPNRSFSEPFEFNMTGIAVRPDEQGVLKVYHVIENSPAGELDIKPGDIVLSVNGERVSFADYVDLNKQLSEPGKTVEFVFERNQNRQTKTIKLRRLL